MQYHAVRRTLRRAVVSFFSESCNIFLFREESEVALGLSTAFRSLAEILAAFWVKK